MVKYPEISTHTPHTGCDVILFKADLHCLQFQLTHPTRGATQNTISSSSSSVISTHTPHTGCDMKSAETSIKSLLFQLTHPTRGATLHDETPLCVCLFQLTHPTRGATAVHHRNYTMFPNFNSHTPHGVRRGRSNSPSDFFQFQLTHPTRGATGSTDKNRTKIFISTHTPHTGCDTKGLKKKNAKCISTHTPHTGCDTNRVGKQTAQEQFQLTHPTRGATADR